MDLTELVGADIPPAALAVVLTVWVLVRGLIMPLVRVLRPGDGSNGRDKPAVQLLMGLYPRLVQALRRIDEIHDRLDGIERRIGRIESQIDAGTYRKGAS